MKNHALWMLIGCALPVVLIFLLPLFGIKEEWALLIFIILMFGCHLFMINWHKKGSSKEHSIEAKKRGNDRH
ncbi:MAG: hypothetical protein GTO17_00595 [Candidatus Aminicenantes bacterium]|nr:hypothetical protein [Candidatus Aminicenantes bacterium]